MTKAEIEVIQNVIHRLKCGPNARESDEVRDALRGPARAYLDTWVTGALQALLPETRDVKLAKDLSGDHMGAPLGNWREPR